jgi:hypothetical protein
MQGIKDILFMAVTTWMTGNHRGLIHDLNAEGISFDHEFAPSFLHWHPVAVRVIDELTVGGQMDLSGDATVEGSARQGLKGGQLGFPGLSNAHRLSVNNTDIIAHALLKQIGVERLERSYLGNGVELH